jgi:hypothetical protein
MKTVTVSDKSEFYPVSSQLMVPELDAISVMCGNLHAPLWILLSGKKCYNFSGFHDLHFTSDHETGMSRTQEDHIASFNIMYGEMENRSSNGKVNGTAVISYGLPSGV